MHGFVSHYTTRLDAKGRFSVPAPFRAALGRDGFDGLYCFPSPHVPAIDAGGNGLIAEIEQRLAGYQALTAEHDYLATALFGASEVFRIDGEGRVTLSETIKAHAGIVDELTVVGLGYKFQIWQKARFDEVRAQAQEIARKAMTSSRPTPGGAS